MICWQEGLRLAFTVRGYRVVVNIGRTGYVYAERRSWHRAWTGYRIGRK